MSVTAWADAALGRALPLTRLLSPRRLIAMNYHAVAREAPPVVRQLLTCQSPEAFASDVAFFRNHYSVVGHERVARHIDGSSPFRERSIVVTFDDGLAECHSEVRPILLREGVPCVFFVVKDLIDNRSLMFRHKVSLGLERLALMSPAEASAACQTSHLEFGAEARDRAELERWARSLRYRDQPTIDAFCTMLGVDVESFLRETPPYLSSGEIIGLHGDGFTIGAHSCDHPELWTLGWEEVERQIVESCVAVRELTGQETVPFSFPFWGSGVDRAGLARLLAEHPWIGCFYDTNGLMNDESFVVNRIAGDSRPGRGARNRNLAALLAKEHAKQPARSLKRAVTRRSF